MNENWRESKVEEVSGVPRETLRDLRTSGSLSEGTDYFQKNGAWWYTPSGCQKIAEYAQRGGGKVAFPEQDVSGQGGGHKKAATVPERAAPISMDVLVMHIEKSHLKFHGYPIKNGSVQTGEANRVVVYSCRQLRGGQPKRWILKNCLQAPDGRWWHEKLPPQ